MIIQSLRWVQIFTIFVQTHVHGGSEATQSSHPLCPLLLLPSIFPNIRVFSNESALHIRWPKYWGLSFSISPSSKHSGLISFRLTGLISLLFKALLRVFYNLLKKKKKSTTIIDALWKIFSSLSLSPLSISLFVSLHTHIYIDTSMLVTQSCPTLCDPMDCSLPGSSVLGILQTTILE